MANNPNFVRLSDQMVHGLVVDMETGWSISGYDVRDFPEDREEVRFARRKLNEGILEAASQSEYDEAHPEEDEVDADAMKFVEAVRVAQGRSGVQEHLIRQETERRHNAVREARFRAKLEEQGIDVDEYDENTYDYATDRARREAVIEDAKEQGLGDEDPEGQKERTATRGARRVRTATKKTGSRRRSVSESEEPSE